MSGKSIKEKRDQMASVLIPSLIDPNSVLRPKTEAEKLIGESEKIVELEAAKESKEIANGAVKFDSTNTYAEHPNMFAEGGGVWTGSGKAPSLINGQRIILGDSFGVQNTEWRIPKGVYTAVKENGISMLKSDDGKYYLTQSKWVEDGTVSQAGSDRPPDLAGYKYNPDGNYYTKEG
jgi:hypothetical protein